jgi:hypothetical protein
MTESMFEFKTFDSDTMLNHHLFQNVKLIGRSKFKLRTLCNVSFLE